MSKNTEMIKSFMKVMNNNQNEISLVIPDMYAQSVYHINYKLLKNKKYKNLIFDIDNTILPVNDINVPNDLIKLFKELEKDFNICIVSNNDKNRVIPVAKALETGYMYKAGKPKSEAFDKALILLDSHKKNTVMIGDQMLSDIKGAKKYGLYTVMVDPAVSKHDIKTGTQRILQKIMMKKLAKKGLFKENEYYDRKWYNDNS